jgi:hypothetical protein
MKSLQDPFNSYQDRSLFLRQKFNAAMNRCFGGCNLKMLSFGTALAATGIGCSLRLVMEGEGDHDDRDP